MIQRLIIIFLFLTSIVYSQSVPTELDSSKIENIKLKVEKLIKDWDPENESWKFCTVELKEPELTILYGQQSIHPLLAEYNRKIQFITQNSKTDIIDMALNTGGRTLIKVYYDKVNNLIIMEDRFGGYYFNLSSFEYSEKLWDRFEETVNKEYLGTINGKKYPLQFIRDKE